MTKTIGIWELTGAHPALYICLLAVDEAPSIQGFGTVLVERSRDKA
jgi:hypothetical protein